MLLSFCGPNPVNFALLQKDSHCDTKVMKLRCYVLFWNNFCTCTCPAAAILSLLALTTNQTEEQINFSGLNFTLENAAFRG